jgi:1-acyl-sn-glycerol-3-phosphate acyltransferase
MHFEISQREIPVTLMKALYWTVLWLTKWYFKIFFRHRVYGLEHSFYQGGAILAANHSSFFDPPIVAISWPQEVHFLARETLFSHFLFGSLIRALNAHPVSGNASDVSTFKMICELLKKDKKVVLFPEGTRSLDGTLSTIKPGIGLLISRTNSAIIPAYIHGSYTAWNRRSRLPRLWGKTACVFGTPLLWKEFAHLDKKEAHQALATRLTQAILDLKNWYDSGAKGTPP